MITIKDMSHEQVIALNDPELNRLVKLALALQGVPLPGAAPEKPEEPKVERDVAVYAVGGLFFTDRNAAEAVGAVLASVASSAVKLDYEWQHVGSEHKYARPYRSDDQASLSTITTERALSEPNFRRVREALIQYKVLQKQYEEDTKKHEAAVSAGDEVRGEIVAVYNDARARQQDLDRTMARFDEYMHLADGDVEVALRFFDKAHTPTAWVRNRLDAKVAQFRTAAATCKAPAGA